MRQKKVDKQDDVRATFCGELYRRRSGYKRRQQVYNGLSLHPQAKTVSESIIQELFNRAGSKRDEDIGKTQRIKIASLTFGEDDILEG